MSLYLGIVLFCFIITSIIIIPFIDILYKLHFTYRGQNKEKVGTPTGGGVLLILLITVLFAVIFNLLGELGVFMKANYPIKSELNILFFCFISFGLLGLYEDIVKSFHLKWFSKIKNLGQITLSLIIGFMLHQNLGIQILNIPVLGTINFGIAIIPLSAFVIYMFTRGFDITDGLDGLAGGCLLIALLAFWAVAFSHLDTPLSIFLGLWVGALLAFMYFNIYPARIWLGNAGSLAFGATFALVGILLGKTIGLFVIGGIFVIEALIQFVNIASLKLRGRPVLKIYPIHYYLVGLGWPEPKVVMRFWILSIVLAGTGLWLSL